MQIRLLVLSCKLWVWSSSFLAYINPRVVNQWPNTKVAQRSSLEFGKRDSNQHFFVVVFILQCFYCILFTFANSLRNADSSHTTVYWKQNNSHIHTHLTCAENVNHRATGWERERALSYRYMFQLAGIPSCSQSKQANHSSPEQLYITHKSCAASHKALAHLQPQSPQSYSRTHSCSSHVIVGFVYKDFLLLLCDYYYSFMNVFERKVWEKRGDGRLYLYY